MPSFEVTLNDVDSGTLSLAAAQLGVTVEEWLWLNARAALLLFRELGGQPAGGPRRG